ncbi:hypothetical protein VTN00DRAFT_3790 [Thermoascus crustaceus]|uniref:uncharacterized protein n=1 Tax=Thermoascus crustaceus TaxID=5088 RepID=UPI0037427CB8
MHLARSGKGKGRGRGDEITVHAGCWIDTSQRDRLTPSMLSRPSGTSNVASLTQCASGILKQDDINSGSLLGKSETRGAGYTVQGTATDRYWR